jgi:hypothetical protein
MLRYSPPRYLLRRHTILNIVKPAESFLEVGAGGLRLSVELLRHFDTGTCIDFAPELKKLHRALPAETRKRLTPIVGDMFALNATKK